MPATGPALTAAIRPPQAVSAARWALISAAVVASGALLIALPTQAQTAAAPAARAKAPAKPAGKAPAKPATSHQKLSSEAKGLALANATTEAISANQLDIAARVLTGAADCEFKQTVTVLALHGKPGLFTVEHKGKRYVMAPRETSTGAVRLEDPAAGVVWLQIPAKSMLMNARIGQRMVDSCQHSEQRAATQAVAGAAQALGIEARKAAPVPDSAASAATAASAALPADPAASR